MTPENRTPVVSDGDSFLTVMATKIKEEKEKKARLRRHQHPYQLAKINGKGEITLHTPLSNEHSQLTALPSNLVLAHESHLESHFDIISMDNQRAVTHGIPGHKSYQRNHVMIWGEDNFLTIQMKLKDNSYDRQCLKTLSLMVTHHGTSQKTMLSPVTNVWSFPLGIQILHDYVFIYYNGKCGDKYGQLAYWKLSSQGQELAFGTMKLPIADPKDGCIHLSRDNSSFCALMAEDKSYLGIMRTYESGQSNFSHQHISFSYHQFLIGADGYIDPASNTYIATEEHFHPLMQNLRGYDEEHLKTFRFFFNPYAKTL